MKNKKDPLKRNPHIATTQTHIFFHGGPLSNWHPSTPRFPGHRALTLCLPDLDALGIPHPSPNAAVTRLIRSWSFTCGEQWMMAMKGWLFEEIPGLDSGVDICDEEFEAVRAVAPRVQKALGRAAEGFREDVWEYASEVIVTAGCVARAEVDSALREVYLASAGRKFVEGSVRDRVWGVGLRWDSVEIQDEANWKGKNRLGRCHDEAARVVRLSS
ncbi:hypothetical protein ANOM_011124 [Aspergillus nomiae NRRL 13137]|uniref:NADAR domain-containing protein n=1 Tax=Aspergillus nomiae NRRL (strain ATCC 15546 / NRRL 13137 / CBS 260.88 / M93) TaxID=1509407 RepID=A0A0L1ILJ4_ASPN3|nr:uncharacterized protein ANOM_011124 [Aspergillus nomiae NRRL 13137]KNG80397.1 hypothetical protein ANOM_011124 [Aspergillus nomiae NRRL 13137]